MGKQYDCNEHKSKVCILSHTRLSDALNGESRGLQSNSQVRSSEKDESLDKQKFTDTVTYSSEWTRDEQKIITAPYNYVVALSGKDMRRHLLNAFNEYLHVPESTMEIIHQVTGMLHNASLLIDDIQDSSPLRRGSPSAHTIFGIAQVINSANYMYFKAGTLLFSLLSTDAHSTSTSTVPREQFLGQIFTIFTQELLHLHLGQGLDLHYRDSGICPSEEIYLKMVGGKTGGLFRLALRLMMLFAAPGASDNDTGPKNSVNSLTDKSDGHPLLLLADAVGKMFQVVDDYKNLASAEYASAKGFCEDITEGKYSLPIIHTILSGGDTHGEIPAILRQKTTDVELKKRVLQIMQQAGTLDYVRDVVVPRLYAEARIHMDRLNGTEQQNVALLKILDRIKDIV